MPTVLLSMTCSSSSPIIVKSLAVGATVCALTNVTLKTNVSAFVTSSVGVSRSTFFQFSSANADEVKAKIYRQLYSC